MQWHQLDHMQTICTSLQMDNHINTSSLNFYRPDALPDAQLKAAVSFDQFNSQKQTINTLPETSNSNYCEEIHLNPIASQKHILFVGLHNVIQQSTIHSCVVCDFVVCIFKT